MYTLERRIKTSLVVPILFLIIVAINMLTRPPATIQTSNSITNAFMLWFLLKLGLIYSVSVLFLSVETLIKVFITDKDSLESQNAAQRIKNAPLLSKISVINNIELAEGTNKITHSVLFQIMMVVLALFASTNSNSLLGRGITLSILIQLLIDQAILLKQKKDLSSWFWQIKAAVPLQFHQAYFGVMVLLFILNVYLAIR